MKDQIKQEQSAIIHDEVGDQSWMILTVCFQRNGKKWACAATGHACTLGK